MMISNLSKTQHPQGFTVIELIVASGVALGILSISLGMLSQQRVLVLGDRTRVTANDNLRLASDLMGQDIKQAGERLEADTLIPAISIIPGASSTDPSTLVLQRQLLPERLPVCQNIGAGSTGATIDISVISGSTVNNCVYSYTAPPSGEVSTTLTALQPTDNLRSWRTFRCTQETPSYNFATDPCASTNSATAWAYIHDPKTNLGEFFQYSIEERASCTSGTAFLPSASNPRTCQRIRRANSTPWQYSYTYKPTDPTDPDSLADPTRLPAVQPRLYLLEERRYNLIADTSTSRTDDYILQLSVNRQTPKRIANQVSNFKVWAKVPTSYTSPPFSVAPSLVPGNWGCGAGGSGAGAPNSTAPNQWYCTAFNVNITDVDAVRRLQYIKDWQDLQGVRITLTGINPNQDLLKADTTLENNILKLSSEFYPRNVASKQ